MIRGERLAMKADMRYDIDVRKSAFIAIMEVDV